MKSLKITNQQEPLQFVEVEKPKPSQNQVLIKLKAAALNRRDQWIREGKYPGIQMDVTLGSDGAGIVAEVGRDISEDWLNKEVIINPNINWGLNPAVQSADYTILGMPTDGTLADYVLVDIDRLVEKPAHLNWEEAAALPLGGVTAFRATFHHGQVSQGKNVLISGVGGGVAQFAFLYAVAAGANVYVTSGQDEKIAHCEKLGAKGGFNYKTEGWQKTAKAVGGFDTVIDSAGGNQINDFIKLMKPAGRIAFYGATNGMPEKLDVFRMFWNQITLQGATMGNDAEFTEMISFINQHKLHPIIDSVRPFDEAIAAFDAMKSGSGFGKLVLSFP